MAKKDFKKTAAELFISAAEDPGENIIADPTPSTGAIIPKGYKLVKENKSERMQLLIRPSIKDAIRQEAMAQGLSMNDLINNIFEEYIERKGRA